MNIKIRKAEDFDYNAIIKYDRHIAPKRLKTVISEGRMFVLERDDNIIGVLRYSLFWESIPFLDLIFIDAAYQKHGYGRAFMAFWESEMKQAGFCFCLASTQEDETAKYFYETIGYMKTGAFLPPKQKAKELIYQKALHF